jgi:lysophospholipase L1-like esterase
MDDPLPPEIDPLAGRTPRRWRARDAVLGIVLMSVLLVLFAGRSVRHAGDQMHPSVFRTVVLGVGHPAGWLADRLPLTDAVHSVTKFLSPNPDLGNEGGFGTAAASSVRGVAPVTPDAFDPRDVGAKPVPPRRPLKTLLVTGDSMSTPLDLDLARRFTGGGVQVDRDPHLGTGISNTQFVDWGKLSVHQVATKHPDAIVVFIGAAEGFPLPGPGGKDVSCCDRPWAAAYAFRVRRMMDTYIQHGTAHVYWLLLPTPREAARAKIARSVNAAIRVAAQPYRAEVRVLDMVRVFTPGARYRAAMNVGGTDEIVRESDGVHLNQNGSSLAGDVVARAIRADYGSR